MRLNAKNKQTFSKLKKPEPKRQPHRGRPGSKPQRKRSPDALRRRKEERGGRAVQKTSMRTAREKALRIQTERTQEIRLFLARKCYSDIVLCSHFDPDQQDGAEALDYWDDN